MLAPPANSLHQRGSRAAFAARPLGVALAVLAVLTAVRTAGTVDSDVAWQLWIAQRMHADADLYRDIIETNPPLWFWMARPAEWLSRALSLRIEATLVLIIGAAVALALAATDRLLTHLSKVQRALLLSSGAIALFAIPWVHVGQREQIVLIGTLPYAALIANRRDGRPVSLLLASLVGLGAALGFALKHYFLLVPLLLELWLLIGCGKRWRPVRPETVAIGIVGIAYAAAIWAEGDYLRSIVPLLKLAYGTYAAPGIGHMFGLPAVIALAMIGGLLVNTRLLMRSDGSFSAALTIAAVVFAAIYFIQFKGWPYHAIPMLGCASLALASLLVTASKPPRSLVLVAPALLCLPLYLSAAETLSEPGPDRDLQRAIAGLPPGTPVGFIAENTALAWSVTLQRQFAYPQRYNGYWMLGALVQSERGSQHNPALLAAWRKAVADTVTDFECLPPRRIIIARPQAGSWNAGIVDPLPYFLQDPGFARLLAHYRPVSRSTLEVYEQVSPVGRPATNACVRGR